MKVKDKGCSQTVCKGSWKLKQKGKEVETNQAKMDRKLTLTKMGRKFTLTIFFKKSAY